MANTSKTIKDKSKGLVATVLSEMKKIRWPKGSELVSNTCKVLVFCALFAIFFLICDSLASGLLVLIGVGA